MNVACSPFEGHFESLWSNCIGTFNSFTHMLAFTNTHTDTFEYTNITNILYKQTCKHAL